VTDEGIPVLTLWQPWASLISLGVKSIETRSWSTQYRGPLAIHAAAKVVYGPVGDYRAETWFSDVQHVADRCYCDDGEVGPPCDRGATRTPCLTKPGAEPLMLPLGAIVATCELVDVVPIQSQEYGDHRHRCVIDHITSKLILLTPGATPVWAEVEDQRPYGDFAPGRYAWLLADVVPVDPPVSFKGARGLTRRWVPLAA
jgi:activating signal cointegrator 1